MAGHYRTFKPDRFREKIRFVFEMAAPPQDERRLTFHFHEIVTYTGIADGDEVPFDPTVPVTRVERPPITVPCDVTFQSAAEEQTAFGSVIPDRVKVLLLDEDFELVKDAAFVVVNGDRYNLYYEPPAFGLFDVGLHELVFQAEQER